MLIRKAFDRIRDLWTWLLAEWNRWIKIGPTAARFFWSQCEDWFRSFLGSRPGSLAGRKPVKRAARRKSRPVVRNIVTSTARPVRVH